MPMQIDYLGRETQFVLVDALVSPHIVAAWEAILTQKALGYTRIAATGGWRGTEEAIHIYRVASLGNNAGDYLAHCLAHWLLLNTQMQDVYLVDRAGEARGYSLQPDGGPTIAPPFGTEARKTYSQSEAYQRAINRIERNPNI